MDILELNLKNYRPYRDVKFDFRADNGHIHIVEGPQGAGKTSFHRAVQWVLYGDTPAPNYRTHWNNIAREKDEPAEVQLKIEDDRGRVHIVERRLVDTDHGTKKAKDEIRVIKGDGNEETGGDAEDWINERIPEDLKDFFFLDGEEIQSRIDEGDEIKDDIETVLKHTAILNARDDLKTLRKDRYESRKRELEDEIDERSEINEKIDELENKRDDYISEKSDKEEELEEAEEQLEEMQELLSERNDELMGELNELDEKIPDLVSKHNRKQEELQTALENLHLGIIDSEVESLLDQLDDEEEELNEKNKLAQRSDIFDELINESRNEGKCVICGSEDFEHLEFAANGEGTKESQNEIQSRLVALRGVKSTLQNRPEFDTNPAEVETEATDIKEELEQKKERREEIKSELGDITTEDGEEIEDTINGLEDLIDDIEREIQEADDKIDELNQEIERLQGQKAELAGNSELDDLEEKISTVNSLLEDLRDVREAHIQRKRDKIKDEMGEIFDKVSQSEFIRDKYKEIDFKGDPHEEDEYVIQLIQRNGEPKDMTNRKPSAGETQLAALSFIFGLNKYANYATTIVFDTVAGRLDLENSKAQGEFFASLDDPIILLVHDGELQKLRGAIEQDIGRHYELKPDMEDQQTITTIKEVT